MLNWVAPHMHRKMLHILLCRPHTLLMSCGLYFKCLQCHEMDCLLGFLSMHIMVKSYALFMLYATCFAASVCFTFHPEASFSSDLTRQQDLILCTTIHGALSWNDFELKKKKTSSCIKCSSFEQGLILSHHVTVPWFFSFFHNKKGQ